jgi:hypothetical protein
MSLHFLFVLRPLSPLDQNTRYDYHPHRAPCATSTSRMSCIRSAVALHRDLAGLAVAS